MSINDDALPGHDDIDAGDLAFVQDLIDKQQAIEDAAHRLAVRAALATMVPWDQPGEYREVRLWTLFHPDNQAAFDDAIIFLTGRCGATFDATSRILRMPKE